MTLSFVHAADFHLGADLRRMGAASMRLETAQFEALEKTLAAASDAEAAFVVICGDLFDSRNPRRSILTKTAEIISRHADLHVFVLPGTHDFLSESSVYSHENTGWASRNLTILNETKSSPYYIPGCNCYLYFRANRSNRSRISPIRDFSRKADDGFHVGLGHGSLLIPGLGMDNDYPISAPEIESSGLDYIALGHWHTPRVEVFEQTHLAYSGIPQPLSFSDPEQGSVFLVHVSEEKNVAIQPVATSTVSFRRISATIFHPIEVKRVIEKYADPDSIVKLVLSYSDNFTEAHEVEEIIKDSESRFLLLQSDNQNSPGFKPRNGNGSVMNEKLIEAYRAELNRLRDHDSAERTALYEKAYDLGVKIISGEI
jgi:DNA repair exonuclease SbcCD nuclease subunit